MAHSFGYRSIDRPPGYRSIDSMVNMHLTGSASTCPCQPARYMTRREECRRGAPTASSSQNTVQTAHKTLSPPGTLTKHGRVWL